MENDTANVQGLRTGVGFASEVLIPGGSNFVKGDLKQGAIHTVLGLAAKAVFGLPGLLLVSANSFTRAASGRHLHEMLQPGPQQTSPEKP